MALIKSYHQFVRQTGLFVSDESLEPFGLFSCDRHGGFRRPRILELQSFCKSNPDFHIVSWLNPNVTINRFAPGARLFFLAQGDQDPHLIHDTTAQSQDLEVLELRLNQPAS